jgi:hypothetical protein
VKKAVTVITCPPSVMLHSVVSRPLVLNPGVSDPLLPTAMPTLVDEVNAAAEPFGKTVSVTGTPPQENVKDADPGAFDGSAATGPAAIAATAATTTVVSISRRFILPSLLVQPHYNAPVNWEVLALQAP